MPSQKFRDTRTGEIVTQIPIHDINHFDEYNGAVNVGDFDLTETQRRLIALRSEYFGELQETP